MNAIRIGRLVLLMAALTIQNVQGRDCAAKNERSQECPGVDNPYRPADCCDGLVCTGPWCVQPDECAAEGERAIECSITDPPIGRFAECCAGLACDTNRRKCVKNKSATCWTAATSLRKFLSVPYINFQLAPHCLDSDVI